MAGDWIKMRHALPDDPAVIATAEACGVDTVTIVGALHRLWSWADIHTTDGNATGVTAAWLDRYVGVPGFAQALSQAAWLQLENGTMTIPHFERHISESAKQRALTAIRADRHRAKKRNAAGVTDALPEKRREEKRSSPTEKNPLPPFPPELDTPEIRDAFEAWLEARPKRGKTTTRALRMAVNKLAEWGPAIALVALRDAAIGRWQGLHKPDEPRALGATSSAKQLPLSQRIGEGP